MDDYAKIRHVAYTNGPAADVVVICFSLNSTESLDNVTAKWQPEIKHYLTKVPVILVGNQKDSRRKNFIPYFGERVAEKIGAVGYRETSAKTGENVQELMNLITTVILDCRKKASSMKKGNKK